MSKRDKRRGTRPAVAAPASPDERRARVLELISSGKTREGLDLAKQWHKDAPSPEDEALVIEAYEARIRQMLAQGLHDDAMALAALVADRFPAQRQRIVPLARQSKAIATGDLGAILAELASAPPARRREIEAILSRELRDPRQLTDAGALPADDPLRQGARAVSELFAAVTSGPLAPGSLAALDQIPRQSPLAPWKLLIRAIDAYYRRADGTALANLDAIPPHAAPARLASVLRRLIGEPAARASAPAGGPRPTTERPGRPGEGGHDRAADQKPASALISAVTGGQAAVRDQLRPLITALSRRDATAAAALVERIVPLLPSDGWSKQTFTATLLWHWHRLQLNPKPLIVALRRDRRNLEWQRETQRLLALQFERLGLWDEALFEWNDYVGAATRAGALPAAGRERGRVLLHMAEVFPEDPEEVLDAIGVDSEEEIDELVDRGGFPESFARGRLLMRALEADPDPRAYRALVAHWERRDHRQAEAHAEAWRRAHPGDLEPLLHLARAAEARGAHRQAIELLDQAEAIDPMHPEVRQSRFRVLLTSAERRIREGRFALALADLDDLDKAAVATSGDTWVYLGALRWLATRRNGDGPAAGRLLEEVAARLGDRPMLSLVAGSVAESFGLEPPEELDGGERDGESADRARRPRGGSAATPAERVHALARASDLFRGLSRPLAVPVELLAGIESGLAGASPADLYSICVAGLHMGRPALTYAASREGLASDGPLLHRFLLARGRALAAAGARRDQDRAVSCLRAARELAGRGRDLDAVREASSALGALGRQDDLAPSGHLADVDDPEPLTAQQIAGIVADERARPGPPAFKAASAGRKRRRGGRTAQRDLFDDILPFMDGAR